MNTRQLGAIAILGGLVGVANSLRLLAIGTKVTPGLLNNDGLTNAAWLVAAIGGLCGLLGFIRLRGTGERPMFRLLAYAPAVGYIAGAVASLGLLIGILRPDASDPVAVGLATATDLVGPAAWLLVAILATAARSWSGWRLAAVWAMVLFMPVGIAASAATGGLVGAFVLCHYLAACILAYAVYSAAPETVAAARIADQAYP